MHRFENGKWWSFGHAPVRSYGSSLTIPREWLKGCNLEPNLGIYKYHQEKTLEKLKEKKWLCFNEQLILSDQDNDHAGNILF